MSNSFRVVRGRHIIFFVLMTVGLAQPGPRGFEPERGRGRSSDDGRDGFVTENSSIIRLEGGGIIDEETVRTARETGSHSTGTPDWRNERSFEKDVFTFARVSSARIFAWAVFAAAGRAG